MNHRIRAFMLHRKCDAPATRPHIENSGRLGVSDHLQGCIHDFFRLGSWDHNVGRYLNPKAPERCIPQDVLKGLPVDTACHHCSKLLCSLRLDRLVRACV